MFAYIIRRLLWSIPVILLLLFVTFAMSRSLPGGPFDRVGDRSLPESIRANLEAKYGLDKPFMEQFVVYVGDVLQGDLGPSFTTPGRSVNDIVAQTLPISAQLGLLSIFLGALIGIPAGILSALRQNTWVDYTSSTISVIGLSIPNIVLAPLLIYVFAVQLDWFPAARWAVNYKELMLGVIPPPNELGDFFLHATLPVITLGTGIAAIFSRLTRASLLQTIREDFIRTARAKGIRRNAIIIRHALRNSLIPVITILGPLFAGLITGTFIVEQFFAIPGMGSFFINSIGNRDYPVVLGTTLVYAVILIAANLLVDIAYAWADPRIRYD